MIGVALSFVLLIHRLDHPHFAILGRSPSGTEYEDIELHEDATAVPSVLIQRFEAPLVFANAEIFTELVLAAVAAADPPPRAVILDFAAVPEIDSTGDAALADLVRTLERRNLQVAFARAMGSPGSHMQIDGVAAALGEGHIFPTVRDAVAAVEAKSTTTARPLIPTG